MDFDSHLELSILAAILDVFYNYFSANEFIGRTYYSTYYMTFWLFHKMGFYHLHKLSTVLSAILLEK